MTPQITSSRKVDRTFSDLCEEIDYLEDQVTYWRTKYETEIRERTKEQNEHLQRTMRGVGQALIFALSVKDDENGNLVILKEDRPRLSETFTS